MISQKESSTNNKFVCIDAYDPHLYAKVQEMQRQYRVARENEWYARQEQASVANIPYHSMNELVSHVRYLESEVGHLKEIVDAKSLWLDASIEEIYGEKI